MKTHIAKHLLGEYQYYNYLIASSRFLHSVVEECIKRGLLIPPEKKICAEGTFMAVKT